MKIVTNQNRIGSLAFYRSRKPAALARRRPAPDPLLSPVISAAAITHSVAFQVPCAILFLIEPLVAEETPVFTVCVPEVAVLLRAEAVPSVHVVFAVAASILQPDLIRRTAAASPVIPAVGWITSAVLVIAILRVRRRAHPKCDRDRE